MGVYIEPVKRARKGKGEGRTEELTDSYVKWALSEVGKEPFEVADQDLPALSLRIGKRTASWILRGRISGGGQSSWRVGDARTMSLRVARKNARAAQAMARAGQDPGEYLELESGGRDRAAERAAEAKALAEKAAREAEEKRLAGLVPWTTARADFLEHVRVSGEVATYEDYRKALTSVRYRDFAAAEELSTTEVTGKILQGCVNKVWDRKSYRQAEKIIDILKGMYAWLDIRTEHGEVDFNAASRLRLPKRPNRDEVDEDDEDEGGSISDHLYTPEELGNLPWLLDGLEHNPYVKYSRGTCEAARLAVLLIELTVQRLSNVASAEKREFVLKPDDGGIPYWSIPAHKMKGRKSKKGKRGKAQKPHIVPLTPAAMIVVQRALAISDPENGYLFPQQRPRREGAKADGHLGKRAIYGTVKRALGSMSRCHLFRHAFATYMSKAGFSDVDIARILDHAEGRTGSVTEGYKRDPYFDEKASIMQAWCAWVAEMWEAQAPEATGNFIANLVPAEAA